MAQQDIHKPGEVCDWSGQYPIQGPAGGKTGEERTVVKCKRFPPPPKAGQTYGSPDATRISNKP